MKLIKVLIIEDDMEWLDLIKIHMPENQFEVTHAKNIETSLELIRNYDYDIICLDLQLPDSLIPNKTIKTVTSITKYVPIIVLTSLLDQNIINFAKEHGIDKCLEKDKFNMDFFVKSSLSIVNAINNKINSNLENVIKKLSILEENLKEIDNEIQIKRINLTQADNLANIIMLRLESKAV